MAGAGMFGDRHYSSPGTSDGSPPSPVETSGLSRTAEAIWRAGVAAVDSARLVRNHVRRLESNLDVCGEAVDLASLHRIIVVGAGKAGAGMARGLEEALGADLLSTGAVEGWINVPADCVMPLRCIHLHAARPAGLNEPTEEGVTGSRRILELVSSMGEHDLCLVLLSGGGSALLPLPIDGISLADKLAVTRCLSRSGAITKGSHPTSRRETGRSHGAR